MHKTAKQIVKILKKSNKIALFHHVGPDGDTLSSSYGLMRALKIKWPNKEIKWVAHKEKISPTFDFIVEDFNDAVKTIDASWTAVIGDNAVASRIFGEEEFMKAGTKIVFDHHQNNINFDHDLYWSEPTLGASSVQAVEIVKALNIMLDSKTAIALIFGILTDTFNFTYSLNDTWPVKAATWLMEFINKDDMDQMYKSYRKRTKKDVAFMAYALSNYKIDSGIAYLKITHKDQQKLKMTTSEVSRVNTIGNIEGIHAWMFFIEDKEEGFIRTSLRSVGFPVNKVAMKFDGGGHIRASGIKLPIDWKEVDKVIHESKKQLKFYLKEL